MSQPERQSADRLDVVVRGGRVLDPGCGVDAVLDVGIAAGRIARLEPAIGRGVARRVVDARGKLVIPGMIDTHAHVYEHVTGSFSLNPDLVGVRAGVTTVVDQGGAGALTVLATDHGRFTLSDCLGEEITSSMRLRPEVTVRAGKVSRPDSPLLSRSLGRPA